jgi:S1-C subfamily serine protease
MHTARFLKLLVLYFLPLVSAGLLLGPKTSSAATDPLTDTIARIKPSVVGVGTYQKTRNPPASFTATGFVVVDGVHVVTNAHVLPRELNIEHKETLIVLVNTAEQVDMRNAQVVAIDRVRDLALLRIEGPPLPSLTIGDSSSIREGQALAFTGFPIGMALGLYPATHRAT